MSLRIVPLFAASVILLSFTAPPCVAQEEPPGKLTIDRIFTTGDFRVNRYPARWLPGGGWARLESSEGPNGGRDLVRIDARTGEREVLVPAGDLVPPGKERPLRVEGWSLSDDRSLLLVYTDAVRVWRYKTRGDYWLLDRSSRELRRLGGDAPRSSLQFAKLSPAGRRAAWVRDGDIWVEDLRQGEITQLTERASERVVHGTSAWVYEEELSVRDGFRWSPGGERIAFWRIDSRGVRRYPLVDHLSGLYPEVREIPYPKTGTRNPAASVGVVDVDGGPITWIELPGDPRQHYVARMEWAGKNELVIQQLDRPQQVNRVFLADASTGEARQVFTDRDAAWVEPCDDLEWIDDGDAFLFTSERDGWRHVWRVPREGGEPRLVTPAPHDVIDVLAVDEDAGRLWYIAAPGEPTRRYLWSARLDGTGAERVTPADAPGTHRYRVAPGAEWAIHTVSRFDVPPVVDLVRLPGHERVRVLAENAEARERFEALRREPVEFFRVGIGDGVELDAWCVRPPGLDTSRRWPLLVYVYGEPAGQTVLDRWSGRRGLWHRMLAQRGWVVMSFDNRGTPAPRGRAWRKCVHRRIGILAPKEQAAAVRAVLEEREWLDPERVGVWGWSGGGSMSLNAVFKFPELYSAAMAVAPVSNQRYYDTIYQERYMGLPRNNVDGYREGSPLHFAKHLQGDLLVVHGTADDNVHWQSTAALVDELVRHRKRFDLMAYPGRTHAIREGANTRLHLRDLLTEWLEEHLPPGPRER